ncbi:major facilitator superfamily transporter [Lasiosphaeris hirsuta]|uniref:Major facilitator superfamily transporter n=1 Tax=Lasiosphaeris hirsuta TaxID=260670 RepID=A0AA40DG60_9PEZI|nr:major facilitator superfamily transporter [Lasiosphaeris hirsuta]
MADDEGPRGGTSLGRGDGRHRHHQLEPTPQQGIRTTLALVALINLSWSLYQLPLIRVAESRLCYDFYAANDPSVIPPHARIPEALCKIDPVQQALSRIQRVMETSWVAGDFLMTIPLVSLAELYGRRCVLWLNLVPRAALLTWTLTVGYFDQGLPVNALMLGPFLSLLGGDCVFNSLVYSLVSGLTDDHILRATFFGFMNAVSSISASQIGPAFASGTMSISLWLPLWIGIVLLLVALPVISALPSGLAPDDTPAFADDHDATPLLWSPAPGIATSKRELGTMVVNRFRAILGTLTTPSRNFNILLLCFFCTSLASSDTKLLPQYISTRYHWTIASVGYLLSCKAVLNFIVLTLIIPVLLRLRKPLNLTGASTRDRQDAVDRAHIRHANICIAFSVLGAVAIALSPTIWFLVPSLLLYGLGIALPMFTYSLLKSPSLALGESSLSTSKDRRSETHVFSIVMLTKAVGTLLGAVLMPTLWIVAIRLKGAAFGLPYIASAVCYGLGGAMLARMKLLASHM